MALESLKICMAKKIKTEVFLLLEGEKPLCHPSPYCLRNLVKLKTITGNE